jgi:hypothetical protein
LGLQSRNPVRLHERPAKLRTLLQLDFKSDAGQHVLTDINMQHRGRFECRVAVGKLDRAKYSLQLVDRSQPVEPAHVRKQFRSPKR